MRLQPGARKMIVSAPGKIRVILSSLLSTGMCRGLLHAINAGASLTDNCE